MAAEHSTSLDTAIYGGDGGDLEFEEISTNKGQNTIWESGDGRVWFGTSESDRKAVKDNAVDDAYYLYEDWDMAIKKPTLLIAEGSTGDFWLVLEEKHSSSDPVEYAAVRINGTTARLDWEQSFRGDIKEVETFVGANLEDDNTEIGYSSSDLDFVTWKPAEDEAIDGGAVKLGTDLAGFVYISDNNKGLLLVQGQLGGCSFG